MIEGEPTDVRYLCDQPDDVNPEDLDYIADAYDARCAEERARTWELLEMYNQGLKETGTDISWGMRQRVRDGIVASYMEGKLY